MQDTITITSAASLATLSAILAKCALLSVAFPASYHLLTVGAIGAGLLSLLPLALWK